MGLGLQLPGHGVRLGDGGARQPARGCGVAEVPVTLRPDGRSRPPHLRSWRDGWRHLRFMLLFSPRWLFLVPGLALATLSLAAFLRLCRPGDARARSPSTSTP